MTQILKSKQTRVCSKCGSDKTTKDILQRYKRKDGTIPKYEVWAWYRDGYGGYWCEKCYSKLKNTPKQFVYKGKTIYSNNSHQRIGVCNFCRAVVGEINAQTGELCKRTNMAHFEYDDDNPEAHRLELCNSCHKRYDSGIPWGRKRYDCGSMTSSRDWYRVKDLKNEFRCRKCHERERRRLHGIKSMKKMDSFFEVTEEKQQVVVVPTAAVAAAASTMIIRCDDCNKSVPAEEVKVWLAPVAVGSYEGEQDPVYMCKRCTKTFLDDNKEYHFEDLLYSVKDAAGKYIPEVLEKWK